jgi:hypothetical protein
VEEMKLTKEHIGKILTLRGVNFRVLCVDDNMAWLVELKSLNHATYSIDGPWELIEERKKPSEIINERMAGLMFQCKDPQNFQFENSASYANARINQIIELMDEQAEEKK